MKYIGENEKWIPGFGVFNPGDQVEFDETLFETGLFEKTESAGE